MSSKQQSETENNKHESKKKHIEELKSLIKSLIEAIHRKIVADKERAEKKRLNLIKRNELLQEAKYKTYCDSCGIQLPGIHMCNKCFRQHYHN